MPKKVNEEKLVKLLRKEAQRFLSISNVNSVGVGYKIKDGKPTKELCIQYTVDKKLRPEALEAESIPLLPASIKDEDGNEIPVDVIERRFEPTVRVLVERTRAEDTSPRQTRRSRQNPLIPGISVSHQDGSAGTLGAFVYDRTTGERYMLSNWHVLHTGSGKLGDIVVQPGPHDGGDRLKSRAGRLVRSHLGLAGDCAIATIQDRSVETNIFELGVTPRRIGKVNLGDSVVKSGRTTGVTHGVVSRVGVVAKIHYRGVGPVEVGGFEIRPNPKKLPPDGEVSMGGDSGSLWLMDESEHVDVAVGLHFAGEATDDPAAEHALACNIHSVFDKLDVTFDAESASDSECAMVRRRVLAAQGAPDGDEAAIDDEALTLEQLERLEEMYRKDPDELLERMRRAVDEDISDMALESGLDEVRMMLSRPRDFLQAAEAKVTLEAESSGLPPEFQFHGMTGEIPINWKSRKFEPWGDLLGWMAFAGSSIIAGPSKVPFPEHQGDSFDFRMDEPSAEHPVEIPLFSDWGTGLYHSRYIARQFEELKAPYAIHCGDVYYSGRSSEFRKYVREPLSGSLLDTEVFMLNANHEMYSGGKWYFQFLEDKRRTHPARQRQNGSYFALQSERFQVIGIDTAYHEDGRFEQPQLRAWLDRRLREGRANGQVNILCSANHPYEYGKTEYTDLFEKDMRNLIADRVDLWFWGNTHYCGLFDRAAETPFLGCCVGHGGFPYKRQRRDRDEPAPLLFLEDAPRFPEWTGLRQGRGNNGFCLLTLRADGTVALTFRDWMKNARAHAELFRPTSGGLLELRHVEPFPMPGRP